jgi:FG-GAP repeat
MPNLRHITTPLAVALAVLGVGAASASASVPDAGGGVRVTSAADLADTLNSDYRGRIVIPRDAYWEMKDRAGNPLRDVPVNSGVEIVGERGPLGTRPTLYTRDIAEQYSLLQVIGNDVHIAGIRFVGPKPVRTHDRREPYTDAIGVIEDFDKQTGRRVLIEDNEMEQWSGGAVSMRGTHEVLESKDWDPAWKKPVPGDAALVRVYRNTIHDNVMDGGGYGTVVYGGAYGTVEGNVFDNNRHAVAASGKANSGYVAKFNYVLHNGTVDSGYYNQHFDVHGTGPGQYGGSAGTYFDIGFNTLRGNQRYYVVKHRPAFMLRGRPEIGAWFHDNVAEHGDLDEAVSLKGQGTLADAGFGEDQKAYNFRASGNSFDTDYTTEIASGDFDGDGQKDVFVANGTAWFYSPGGLMPWKLLHESTKRTRDLAFADIDNDGKTDVLYRDGAGRLGYLKSGTVDLQPLTTLPVPISELRFGDFDGDGKTDMFYTRNQQWYVWYGKTRAWTATNSSVTPVSQMLLGDFDNVKGTDVVAVRNGQWSISSGSTSGWARLNAKLTNDFGNAAVADFNGDGRDDIAVGTSSSWRYSSGGRAPLVTMRTGSGLANLKSVQLGRFGATPRAIAVAFVGDRLAHWKGLGAASTFYTRSLQDMR